MEEEKKELEVKEKNNIEETKEKIQKNQQEVPEGKQEENLVKNEKTKGNNKEAEELKGTLLENKEDSNEEKAERSSCESKNEDLEIEKGSKKKNKKMIILIFIICIFCIILSTIFALFNMNNDKMVNGVYINGINISGLTEEQAENKIKEQINEVFKADIVLKYEDYNTTITPEQIEMTFEYEKAIEKAKQIGRTNNIIIDNYSILKANIFKTNIDMQIEYNHEVLSDMIKNIDAELPGALKEVSYEIDDDKLIINSGKDGVVVNQEKLEECIVGNIKNQLSGIKEDIPIPVESYEAKAINIEEIYKEIYKEPKNAYIEEDPFQLHVEEEGLDFDISMEEAKEIVSVEKETYEIPLKITKPKVTTSDLGDQIFRETLSKYTTIYDAGNTSRATNIAIAAKTINGTVILPGETFSYNKVLGNTTKEKGYQLGGAYVGGKIVQTYGGGICQVSSTLYNAVLYANLEIVERYNHSYAVSYVPAGRDATVSYGGKDFKFKNTRTYPVKIVASAKNGVVSISFKGIKEEKEYDIEITSTVLSTTPYSTVYEKNSSLQEGKQKVIQVGHNGLKSKAYKIVKYNGKTISTTLLSSDTYKPMNRIIEKGTKKVKEETRKETETSEEENNTEDNEIEEAEITENED